MAVCYPDGCSYEDIFYLTLSRDGRLRHVPEGALPQCFESADLSKDRTAIIWLCVLLLLPLLVAISTVYRVYKEIFRPDPEAPDIEMAQVSIHSTEVKGAYMPGLCVRMSKHSYSLKSVIIDKLRGSFVAFSLNYTWRYVSSTSRPPDSFDCVDGIRALSTMWIVYGHMWGMLQLTGRNNKPVSEALSKGGIYQLVTQMPLAVDTFLLMSGMLLAVSFHRNLQHSDYKLSAWMIIRMYINRYFRVMPVYAVLLCIWLVFYKYLAAGPVFNGEESGFFCDKWWTNILLANNIAPRHQCFDHAWYLAVDFQLWLVSPIVLVPLFKWRHVGYAVMVILFLATAVANIVVHQQFLVKKDLDLFRWVYIKPWFRAGPFLIGVALGYMAIRSKFNIPFKWWQAVAGWVLSFLFTIGVVFLPMNYFVPSMGSAGSWPVWIQVIVWSLHRIVFSVGVAWMIVACCAEFGGIVNRVLSFELFMPLAKLSYCTYMVHVMVMRIIVMSTKSPVYVDWQTVMIYYWGFLALSVLAGLVVSLVVELPTSKMASLLLGTKKRV